MFRLIVLQLFFLLETAAIRDTGEWGISPLTFQKGEGTFS